MKRMAYKKRTKRDNDQAMMQLLFGDEPSPPEKPPAGPEVLSVTELTERIRFAVKRNLPGTIIVAGEISNLTLASSGHIYFTLKDAQSQIGCAMWRSKAMRVKFQLTDGMAVLVHGSLDVYGPRGQYQFYAEKITPAGMGELELAFRQLKEKLEKEGLFDPAHKKPIPAYPLTIAVVTSPTGAAVRDILRTLELRWPVGRVLLYPVAVQGDQAAPQIVKALNELNAQADRLNIDVILLGRGGGSLEDLWAFNTESVVRAVVASKLPIICGVGHEVDVTIAELVADLRAATPTAAAQHATPVLSEVLGDLGWQYNRLKNITLKDLTIQKGNLQRLSDRPMFRNPVMILSPFAQRVDESVQRLSHAIESRAKRSRQSTHNVEVRLNRISPNVLLSKANYTIVKLEQRLNVATNRHIVTQKENIEGKITRLRKFGLREKSLKSGYELSALETRLRNELAGLMKDQSVHLGHLEARLAGCDYRRVLNRGFSIARRVKDSKIVTSKDQIALGEAIVTELADGQVISEVREKK
jgi:exodeoxyribonuclease VII large subunit